MLDYYASSPTRYAQTFATIVATAISRPGFVICISSKLKEIVIGIFIFLSRESDEALYSSLRSCRLSVYHTKMGKSREVPFPTAQQVDLPAFSTLSFKC